MIGMTRNKVEYYGETLIDLTDSTVTTDSLSYGEVAYNAAGEKIVGTGMVDGVPTTYEILDSIGGKTDAYIDTGLNLDGGLEWEVECLLGEGTTFCAPMNAHRSTSSRMGGTFNQSLGRFYYYWTGVTYATHNINDNIDLYKPLKIKQNKDGVTITQGAYTSTVSYSGTTATDSSRPLTMFRSTQNSNSQLIYIYSAKISKNGVVLRDFVPVCKRSDATLGMYDRINHVFYTAVGGGEFVLNPNGPGQAYAILDSEGTLTFFRSYNEYTAGEGQTAVDVNHNFYAGELFTGIEAMTSGDPPWTSTKEAINKVACVSTQAIKPLTLNGWFSNCSNLTDVDISSFDTSSVTDFSYLFLNDSKLTSLDLNNFDTSKGTNFFRMFHNCSKLSTIYADDWYDSSRTVTSDDMFFNCLQLPNHSNSKLTWNYARKQPSGYFT